MLYVHYPSSRTGWECHAVRDESLINRVIFLVNQTLFLFVN